MNITTDELDILESRLTDAAEACNEAAAVISAAKEGFTVQPSDKPTEVPLDELRKIPEVQEMLQDNTNEILKILVFQGDDEAMIRSFVEFHDLKPADQGSETNDGERLSKYIEELQKDVKERFPNHEFYTSVIKIR